MACLYPVVARDEGRIDEVRIAACRSAADCGSWDSEGADAICTAHSSKAVGSVN